MENLSQLVFSGEVLPGHHVAAVKANLAALLKVDAAQAETLFSGRKAILRKNLSAAEVTLYQAHLEKVGVRVVAEPMTALTPPIAAPIVPPPIAPVFPPAATTKPASTPALQPTIKPETPAASVVSPALSIASDSPDEINCPKCGERQPPRTLCRSCSIDMKRFAAAQAEAELEAREARVAAREDVIAARRGGSRSDADETPSMLGWGFAGRMGRSAYFAGSFLSMSVLMFAALIFIKTHSKMAMLLGVLLCCYFWLRLVVLRCHDKNWSGWLTLLSVIPIVGAIFSLMLSFAPGTAGDNDYGEQPASAGFKKVLLALGVCMLSFFLIYQQTGSEQRKQLLAMAMQQESASASTGDELDVEVEIYTINNCPDCKSAMIYMSQHDISYVEKNVEADQEDLKEFLQRGGRDVPYLVVNGDQTMTGFDPQKLERMRGK